jgi:hypothetical protein
MGDIKADEDELKGPSVHTEGSVLTESVSPTTPLQKSPMPTNHTMTKSDVSALFTSPVPVLAQPVMTPFRLHENETNLESHQPSATSPVSSESVESTEVNRLGSLSPHQVSILDNLVSPTPGSATTKPDHSMSATPSITPTSLVHGRDAKQKRREMNSIGRQDRPINVTHSSTSHLSPSTPQRKQPQSASSNRIFPTNLNTQFHESLAPVTSPSPTRPLPFPITPQRASNGAVSYQSFTLGSSTTPSSINPALVTVQSNHAHSNVQPHTTSRIPVPVTTPVKRSQGLSNTGGASNIGATVSITSPLTPPNILSPNMSQLRQPSNLRNTLTGAASKIPRPGKKPYSKPVSRLPKPKALAKSGPVATAPPQPVRHVLYQLILK